MSYWENNGKRIKVTQNIQDEINISFGGAMSIHFEGCEPPPLLKPHSSNSTTNRKKERSYMIMDGQKVYAPLSNGDYYKEKYEFNGYSYNSKQARDDAEYNYWKKKREEEEEYYY